MNALNSDHQGCVGSTLHAEPCCLPCLANFELINSFQRCISVNYFSQTSPQHTMKVWAKNSHFINNNFALHNFMTVTTYYNQFNSSHGHFLFYPEKTTAQIPKSPLLLFHFIMLVKYSTELTEQEDTYYLSTVLLFTGHILNPVILFLSYGSIQSLNTFWDQLYTLYSYSQNIFWNHPSSFYS